MHTWSMKAGFFNNSKEYHKCSSQIVCTWQSNFPLYKVCESYIIPEWGPWVSKNEARVACKAKKQYQVGDCLGALI